MARRAFRAIYWLLVCAALSLAGAPLHEPVGWFEAAAEIAAARTAVHVAASQTPRTPAKTRAAHQVTRRAAQHRERPAPRLATRHIADSAPRNQPVAAPPPRLRLYLSNRTFLC